MSVISCNAIQNPILAGPIFHTDHSQNNRRSRLFIRERLFRRRRLFIRPEDNEGKPSAKPVYVPTPAQRDLRTPHSGYHFDGSSRRFFEGWYFKVSIPEQKQSFCFMYSDEDPAFFRRPGVLDELLTGPRFPGIGAQILGADEKYICQYSNEVQSFWGSRHELALGNTFLPKAGASPPKREIIPQVEV